MKIREAVFEDIKTIAFLGYEMLHESPVYRNSAYDEDNALDMIAYMMNHPTTGIVLVVEHEGQVVGGMLAYVDVDWFGTDKYAQDLGMFVVPEHRNGYMGAKLIKRYIEEAQGRGAKQIRIGNTTGVNTEQMYALYERMGFVQIGRNYLLGE